MNWPGFTRAIISCAVRSETSPEAVEHLKSRTASLYLDLIERYRGESGGRLLEVGSGEGDFLASAIARGFRVTGVEVFGARLCGGEQKARFAALPLRLSVGKSPTFQEQVLTTCAFFPTLSNMSETRVISWNLFMNYYAPGAPSLLPLLPWIPGRHASSKTDGWNLSQSTCSISIPQRSRLFDRLRLQTYY